MSLFQLCRELGMTKAELIHGRGARMSAHELCVEWPLYMRLEAELQQRQEQLRDTVLPEQFDEEFGTYTPPPPERIGGGG